MTRIIALVLVLAAFTPEGMDPRSVLTRAMLDRQGQPTLLAELPELSVSATMAMYGGNDDVQTWKSADGVSLSFLDGILVSSRGLGADLMSADVSGTRAMLAGGGSARHIRLHSYLNGKYQPSFRAYQCRGGATRDEVIVVFDRRLVKTRIEEVCHTPDATVTNMYWIGQDRFVWKSQQWVSQSAGYLLTERLVR